LLIPPSSTYVRVAGLCIPFFFIFRRKDEARQALRSEDLDPPQQDPALVVENPRHLEYRTPSNARCVADEGQDTGLGMFCTGNMVQLAFRRTEGITRSGIHPLKGVIESRGKLSVVFSRQRRDPLAIFS
jgi:hypothetical protein